MQLFDKIQTLKEAAPETSCSSSIQRTSSKRPIRAVVNSNEDGSRFEPDFVLFLRKKGAVGVEQYQLFVEPKGEHLLAKDAWKESFLKSIEKQAIPVKRFADDHEYRIIGLPFYNHLRNEDVLEQWIMDNG